MATYINWSYQVLITDHNNHVLISAMNTIIILCHVHFMYNAVKKARELELESRTHLIFIFGFTLLQNSTTIDEFNLLLKLLHTIFKQNYCDPKLISDCVTKLETKIASRNIDVLKDSCKYDATYEKIVTGKTHIETLFISEDFFGKTMLQLFVKV